MHSTSLVTLLSRAVEYVDSTSGERHESLNKSPGPYKATYSTYSIEYLIERLQLVKRHTQDSY